MEEEGCFHGSRLIDDLVIKIRTRVTSHSVNEHGSGSE